VSNIKSKIKFHLEKLFKSKQRKKDFSLDDHIKLYYWKLSKETENLGDYLSKVVVSHYMPKNVAKTKKKRKTIYAIGSILGFRCQNAVVWGSGVLSAWEGYKKNIAYSKLDVRAVRGPKTREFLESCGKICPEVYGDPAILMPKIYMPISQEKKVAMLLPNSVIKIARTVSGIR
jgi:pyruvyltransferase